jgi:hypothetical protein
MAHCCPLIRCACCQTWAKRFLSDVDLVQSTHSCCGGPSSSPCADSEHHACFLFQLYVNYRACETSREDKDTFSAPKCSFIGNVYLQCCRAGHLTYARVEHCYAWSTLRTFWTKLHATSSCLLSMLIYPSRFTLLNPQSKQPHCVQIS